MTKKLAFSSIMTALTAVALYGSILLPTGKIAALVVASLLLLVTTAECGTRYGCLSFAATSILALLFMPLKLQVVTFIGFLGYYPMVKSYIERIRNIKLEWLVKVFFFSAVLIVTYFTLRYILVPRIDFGVAIKYVLANLPIVVLAAEVVFIGYDYLLSLLASYYMNVVQKRMKR